MLVAMPGIPKRKDRSLAGRTFRSLVRIGSERGLRAIEIDPETFRKELSEKHGLWLPSSDRLRDVPIEKLDQIAAKFIRQAERKALVGGIGFGFGGWVTFVPDISFLALVTLQLIQRLSLLYGVAPQGQDERLEMWKATAAASGIDYGKDLAEKKFAKQLAPKIARRLAAKMGAEAAEKWVGRMIPLASSALGGALNFGFVRGWGQRVQKNLSEKCRTSRAGGTISL
jgi:hypothetical protein